MDLEAKIADLSFSEVLDFLCNFFFSKSFQKTFFFNFNYVGGNFQKMSEIFLILSKSASGMLGGLRGATSFLAQEGEMNELESDKFAVKI